MSTTKNNHYIPCAWSAYWNFEFLEKRRLQKSEKGARRNIKIFCLNLRADKLLNQKTEKVFVQKEAGIAILTKENVLDYCKRTHPNDLEEMEEYFKNNPSDLKLDFENHFTNFEQSYLPILEKVITEGRIDNIAEKTILSMFVYFQITVNYNYLNLIEKIYKENKWAKFEVFLSMKNAVSNPDSFIKLILPILSSKWKLYKVSKHLFPLGDVPILQGSGRILAPLCPDLLLDINLKHRVSDKDICEHKSYLPFYRYSSFKKRIIKQSSREIIFGNEELLRKWKNSKRYKKRFEEIKKFTNNGYK